MVKLSGLLGGVFASLQSGSRGGWVAIPVVAVLILYLRSRHKTFGWNIALPLAIVAGVGAVYGFSPVARERIDMVVSDFQAYRAGQKDTPVGIRLQLYEAALTLVARRPLLGLGGEGFRDSMRALEEDKQLTPLAAQLGRGETHNQLLAYTVDYGLIGGLALLAIYIVPGMVFYRALQTGDRSARRAGLMGLVFVVSFGVFGLTVETFDLKSTVSLYATVVAILAATATRIRPTVGAGVSSSQ
jgi:O-antigen ligase